MFFYKSAQPWLITSVLVAVAGIPALAPAGDVLLQYFESRWETIERRMPDIFVAGYDGLWVPPPGKADTGGFSVGYDVYDRFNLGNPFDRTLYGTEQGFLRLSREMDQAGIGLTIDAVLNHNGFRDASSPGFAAGGDYPGFVITLPADVDGDFHGAFEGGEQNGRTSGLIDIAQEKNHQFTRHPIPGSPNPIPNEPQLEKNRQYYWPYDGSATPYQDNATGLLTRYIQWMVKANGVDGFRLDAEKHIPQWFFNNFYDAALNNIAVNPIDNTNYTPFSFGESLDTNFDLLGSYIRKDGFGNRDVLDFPLFFTMTSVFNAGGFGSMRNLEFASVDAIDGNANDGSRGVIFATSHDNFGGGFFNGHGNLPHVHILTRAGYPVIYYNAHEFGNNRDFPKDGRGDALGNFGSTLTKLLEINKEYIRGGQSTRWIDDDVYIYERTSAAIIGINDRGDSGFESRNIATGFAPGTVLVELTGNATNSFVDPNNDIFDSVTVGMDSRVTIRVPRNSSASGFHGRGYVIYGPEAPRATLTITNAAGTLGPDSIAKTPEGARRLTPLQIVTADTINVTLQTDAAGPIDDNALIKLNYGMDINGGGNVFTAGEFAGFEQFASASPRFGGGTGTYSVTIDATNLEDGYQYIETAAFLKRDSGPAILDMDRAVVYLDRMSPEVDLLFPPQTGDGDIRSRTYEAVVSSDRTVNSLHILRNVAPSATDSEILALTNSTNQARQHDRLEWRSVLTNIAGDVLELTVVAFEENGTYSITRFGNIGIELSYPEVQLGVDTNASPTAVNFQPVPATINQSAYSNDFVVRVDTTNVPGGPISFASGDFTVQLQVDSGTPIVALPFNPAMVGVPGILLQNDQNLGDEFDEFRFVWRGYSTGGHTFRATAELSDHSHPAYEAVADTFVPEGTPGPAFVITTPAPPNQGIDNPSSISVAGTFTDDPAFAQVFFDTPEGAVLLATLDDPPAGAFSVSKIVGSYNTRDVIPVGALQTENGTFTVRVVASTGANGTGISAEKSSSWTITGQPVAPKLEPLKIDGNAAETLSLPVLAVSAADGGSGTANPADFGADGTLTELHAAFRDNKLVIALRGDMFGSEEENLANASYVYIDVNAGSGEGATDIATQLNDVSDGLRTHISSAQFTLSPALTGIGIDAIVGMTEPSVAFGYTLGTDGTEGSFTEFAYQAGIIAAYDNTTAAIAPAAGTTIAGPDTFEIEIPLTALGNPDPTKIRIAAVTAGDSGFASPNTLPENSNNGFTGTEIIEEMAGFSAPPVVLINEVFTGHPDWIELYNPNGTAVNISGWALRMNDSDNVPRDYLFPNPTFIAANDYFYITDNVADTGARREDTVDPGFNFTWDQTRGGSLALVDQSGIGVDYVDWRSSDDSPLTDINRMVPAGTTFTGIVVGAAGNTLGESISRDSSHTDTDTAADWTAGTPTGGPDLSFQNHGWVIH